MLTGPVGTAHRFCFAGTRTYLSIQTLRWLVWGAEEISLEYKVHRDMIVSLPPSEINICVNFLAKNGFWKHFLKMCICSTCANSCGGPLNHFYFSWIVKFCYITFFFFFFLNLGHFSKDYTKILNPICTGSVAVNLFPSQDMERCFQRCDYCTSFVLKLWKGRDRTVSDSCFLQKSRQCSHATDILKKTQLALRQSAEKNWRCRIQ